MPNDGTARIRIRGRSRGDERLIGLDGDAFEPGPIARQITEEFLGHVEAITELQTLQEITR